MITLQSYAVPPPLPPGERSPDVPGESCAHTGEKLVTALFVLSSFLTWGLIFLFVLY